jgi:hypothetical protein
MIIFGHKLLPKNNFFKVNSIDEVKKTKSNSTVFIKFSEKNIELIYFVISNEVETALEVVSIEEAILAENLGAKFLVIENQKLAIEVQKLAEHYLFDSKILVLINNPHEIEEIVKLRIDGAILSNHIIH